MPFRRERNSRALDALRNMRRAPEIRVGIIGKEDYAGEGLTTAQVAFWNEFGTETIPERSFIRSAMVEQKQALERLIAQLTRKVQAGEMQFRQAAAIIGEFLSDKMRRKAVRLNTPPNAPSTVAKKKSSNPLVDTGQMKNSISYEVRNG